MSQGDSKGSLTFVECLVEIRALLIGEGKADPELEDVKWLVKLTFLADITTHPSELYLRLQGQIGMCVFEVWKGFVSKLDVYTRDIQTVTFCIFNI